MKTKWRLSDRFENWDLVIILIRSVNKSDLQSIFLQIDRLIPVAGKEELTNFNHLFWKKTRKNLTDGHIWFSVVNRPVRSRFTRVQRLTCCISLLFCSMMASIAFYGADDGLKTEVQSQIYISLLSFLDDLVNQPKNLVQFCFVRHASSSMYKPLLDTGLSVQTLYLVHTCTYVFHTCY